MRNADEVLVRWLSGPVGVEEYEDEWVPLNMMRQTAPQLVIDFLFHVLQNGTVNLKKRRPYVKNPQEGAGKLGIFVHFI